MANLQIGQSRIYFGKFKILKLRLHWDNGLTNTLACFRLEADIRNVTYVQEIFNSVLCFPEA